MLKTGIIGSVVAAICCFTPVLVWIFAGLGVSAALAWMDFILLPMLAIFLVITGAALWKRRQSQS